MEIRINQKLRKGVLWLKNKKIGRRNEIEEKRSRKDKIFEFAGDAEETPRGSVITSVHSVWEFIKRGFDLSITNRKGLEVSKREFKNPSIGSGYFYEASGQCV